MIRQPHDTAPVAIEVVDHRPSIPSTVLVFEFHLIIPVFRLLPQLLVRFLTDLSPAVPPPSIVHAVPIAVNFVDLLVDEHSSHRHASSFVQHRVQHPASLPSTFVNDRHAGCITAAPYFRRLPLP